MAGGGGGCRFRVTRGELEMQRNATHRDAFGYAEMKRSGLECLKERTAVAQSIISLFRGRFIHSLLKDHKGKDALILRETRSARTLVARSCKSLRI